MSSTAHRNMAAANDWAAKKKEAMERARLIKEERKAAGPGYSSTSRPDSSRPAASPAPQPPYATSYDLHGNGRGGGYSEGHYNGGGYDYAPTHRRRPSHDTAPQHHTYYHSTDDDRYHTASNGGGGGGIMSYQRDPTSGDMPEIDLRPVRVRRPPSSSRIHSQGQPTDALSLEDDWSSPAAHNRSYSPEPRASHPRGYAPMPKGYQPPPGGYPLPREGHHHHQGDNGYSYDGSYSAHHKGHHDSEPRHHGASYYGSQPQRGSQKQQQEVPHDYGSRNGGGFMGTNARRASPSHGRRSQKPEWNSEFSEPDPADEPESAYELQARRRVSNEGVAPRAGRRSGKPAGKQRPEWNFDTELPDDSLEGSGHGGDNYGYGYGYSPSAEPKAPPMQPQRKVGSGARRVQKPEWNSEPAEQSYIDSVTSRANQANGAGAAEGAGNGHGGVRNLASKGLAKLKALRAITGRRPGSSRDADGGGTSRQQNRGGERDTPMAPNGHPRGGFGAQSQQPPEFADSPMTLIQCDGCGRKFNEKALERHSKVCQKVFQQKRKPMDMSKQRVGGTEAAKHYSGSSEAPRPSAIKQAAMERKQAAAAKQAGRGGGHTYGGASAYRASDYEDQDDGRFGRPGSQQQRIKAPPTKSQAAQPKRGTSSRPPWQQDEPPSFEYEYDDGLYSRGRHEEPPAYSTTSGMDGVPEFAPSGNLKRCNGCGRSFNPEAFAKHSRVCKKVFQQARKPLDMTKQRVAGTEAAKFIGKSSSRGAGRGSGRAGGRGPASGGLDDRVISTKATNQPKWKQQSQGLREAMKANRAMNKALKEGKDIRDIPIAPSGPDPSLVPCPHCGRTFSETAAERHIPRCRDIQAKPKFLSRGSGKGAYNRMR